MEPQLRQILLIDDDEDEYILIRERLRGKGTFQYTVDWASSLEAGRKAMEARPYDAVLVDYRMGAQTGIDLIREAVAKNYPAPILLLTGQGSYNVDLEAMQAGAADYLNKSEMESSLLERSIRYAIERKQHEEDLRRSEQALRESESRFRIALSNTRITVFTTDRELRYTWVYSAMMDSAAEDLIGKHDDDFLSPEDAAVLMTLKRRALEQKAPVVDEVEVRVSENQMVLIVSIEPFIRPGGLVGGVIGAYVDVTDERRMERERAAHHTEMEVQRRLTEHRERERQAIARELHDGPVQNLSGLIFGIQFLKTETDDPMIQEELEKIGSSLRESVSSLRELMNELRPPSLIRFGVGKAIQHHLDGFQEKHPHLHIGLNIHEETPETPLPEQVNLNLYRIYNEAMNNIARHADASRVLIELRQANGLVEMQVHDNGKGFMKLPDLAGYTEKNHFGLAVMKERAEMIGGDFSVTTEREKGTTIRVRVHLP